MAGEIPHDFIELFESLTEGTLDERGHERLLAMIRENPELLEAVRDQFAISGALEELGGVADDFTARTASHVVKIAAEGELDFPRKVAGRIVRHRVVRALAVAAVLALVLLPLFWKTAEPGMPVSPAVATLVRMDDYGGIIATRAVHAGSRISAKAGLIRLTFGNGAVVAVEAPAELTVVSETEIALESGRLNGWCPESAHGFVVRTSSASLTDLGTSFGVNASADGRAEFVVLNGEVEVENGGERRRLSEGDAIQANRRDPLETMVFDPSGFRKTWPLSYGILATRGAVVPADPDVPEKLLHVEDDDNVLVIPERRDVPFDRPIKAEMTGPGTLPGDFGPLRILEPQPEKRLSSFLIRYNPVGTFPEDHFIKFEGEVTFDRPVLAIAGRAESLEHTDAAFATGAWPSTFRGIELKQIDNPPDSVTLSEDRRTVKVIFYAGASTDEVRVILEDN